MNTFNAATFLDVSSLGNRAVQRLGHADEADQPQMNDARLMAAELRAAARRFSQRHDSFAAGKATTCFDMADKLQRYGSFASDKQADFARKLVEWSLPRAQQAAQIAPGSPIASPVAPSPVPAPATRLEALFDVMQGMAKLRLGDVTIARKNGDSLCWVKWAGHEQVVGKIERGVLTVFAGRLRGVTAAEVEARLRVINLDPKAAAARHGQESGNCSVCGRDLTDPSSIALGIGPVCLGNF